MDWKVTIGSGNGYRYQHVRINNVNSGSKAKDVVRHQYPGANVTCAVLAS